MNCNKKNMEITITLKIADKAFYGHIISIKVNIYCR